MLKNLQSSQIELMMGDPIYPRESASIVEEVEFFAPQGKKERLQNVKNLRRRATSKLACKLENIVIGLEGRPLSNAAFGSLYLDPTLSVDFIVKRLDKAVVYKADYGAYDSTLGSRWHKYKDGDNASLRDLQLLSNKIGKVLLILIGKERELTQKCNRHDQANCLQYIKAYEAWWLSQSRFIYHILQATNIWTDIFLEEQYGHDGLLRLNEYCIDDEDFFDLLLGPEKTIEDFCIKLSEFYNKRKIGVGPVDMLTLALIKKLLRKVNGETGIVRLGRLLK